MATKGGEYVVVYITPINIFCSGQSLSDGKDQSFSAKVYGTLVYNISE